MANRLGSVPLPSRGAACSSLRALSRTASLLNFALASGLCQAIGMARKRTKADRLERQTEQLEKGVDRHPDEIEKKKTTREDVSQAAAQTTLAPKSDEPTVLIPIEQRGRTHGHDLEDWLQAECEIKGTQANAAAA